MGQFMDRDSIKVVPEELAPLGIEPYLAFSHQVLPIYLNRFQRIPILACIKGNGIESHAFFLERIEPAVDKMIEDSHQDIQGSRPSKSELLSAGRHMPIGRCYPVAKAHQVLHETLFSSKNHLDKCL
jgi:hypothetical protein